MAKHETFLSDTNKATKKVTLVSYDKTFSDDLEIAGKFNKFFKNAVNNLPSNEDLLLSTTRISDPVQIAIEKYTNNSSILTIQNNVTIGQSFSFQMASTDTIFKQINLLSSKKNGMHGGILPLQMSKISRQ